MVPIDLTTLLGQEMIDPEHHPAQERAGGEVDEVMLLGEDAADGDEQRERHRVHAQVREQVHRRQHRHGRVHAGKAVGRGIEALDEREEFLRIAAALVDGAPFVGRRHREEHEERHLRPEQQDVAHGDVQELAGIFDGEIDVDDDRVIQSGIDPDPARAVRDGVVEGRTQHAGPVHVITLAPEIKLVDPHDEKDAHDEVDCVVRRCHGSCLF